MTYHSPGEYIDGPIHAAAVFCSDGRFGEHTNEFLKNGLGLERCDLVVLPGGPARLIGMGLSSIEKKTVLAELNFLVTAHKLDRVILIQHESCAFYKHHTKLEGDALRPRQASDLVEAARTITANCGKIKIEGYHARPTPDGMNFTPVEL